MGSLRRPSDETIRAFLASQSGLGLTYEAVGATAAVPAEGYAVDHTRIKPGEGEEVFLRAKAALGRWEQFRLVWVEVWPSQSTIEAGDLVAVVAHKLGLWWLNACRIAYVVDEPGVVSRHGFAYGTLPDHAGTGEERFLVEWDRATGEVWYDILAFSRPRLVLTRLRYSYLRRPQRRFGNESAAAMLKAIGDSMWGTSNRGEKRRAFQPPEHYLRVIGRVAYPLPGASDAPNPGEGIQADEDEDRQAARSQAPRRPGAGEPLRPQPRRRPCPGQPLPGRRGG